MNTENMLKSQATIGRRTCTELLLSRGLETDTGPTSAVSVGYCLGGFVVSLPEFFRRQIQYINKRRQGISTSASNASKASEEELPFERPALAAALVGSLLITMGEEGNAGISEEGSTKGVVGIAVGKSLEKIGKLVGATEPLTQYM